MSKRKYNCYGALEHLFTAGHQRDALILLLDHYETHLDYICDWNENVAEQKLDCLGTTKNLIDATRRLRAQLKKTAPKLKKAAA